MGIRIVADSTCDLSDELIRRYNITIIPLSIIMGTESHYDGEDITPDDIFAWADANKTTPKTSAVSQDRTLSVLKPMMDAGDDIIFFGISSSMSSTCNVAQVVMNGYDKGYV
nr:DegV family protein [Lachnospiraceae bacterium]